MPIVTVEVVAGANAMAPDVAQALADAIGRALKSPPGQTWVRVGCLVRNCYAENEAPLNGDQLPVFVTVLKNQIPPRAELEGEVTALTDAVAHAIGRPADCVHVEYAPAAAGRLAFGGILVQ